MLLPGLTYIIQRVSNVTERVQCTFGSKAPQLPGAVSEHVLGTRATQLGLVGKVNHGKVLDAEGSTLLKGCERGIKTVLVRLTEALAFGQNDSCGAQTNRHGEKDIELEQCELGERVRVGESGVTGSSGKEENKRKGEECAKE
jgi:hypothetical protein